MSETFKHTTLQLQNKKKVVYTAISKHNFYLRMIISSFVLERGAVPLNPFMVFDYFLADLVDRDTIREANNNLVRISDEIWVFGTVSDGVLAEIIQAKSDKKRIRYFEILKDKGIKEIQAKDVVLEDEIRQHQDKL